MQSFLQWHLPCFGKYESFSESESEDELFYLTSEKDKNNYECNIDMKKWLQGGRISKVTKKSEYYYKGNRRATYASAIWQYNILM